MLKMKYVITPFAISVCFVLMLLNSCKKPDNIDERFLGKWQLTNHSIWLESNPSNVTQVPTEFEIEFKEANEGSLNYTSEEPPQIINFGYWVSNDGENLVIQADEGSNSGLIGAVTEIKTLTETNLELIYYAAGYYYSYTFVKI